MDYRELTPEQGEKLRSCETPEELLAFIKEDGTVLTEDELDLLSGGVTDEEIEKMRTEGWKKNTGPRDYSKCPFCGSTNIIKTGGIGGLASVQCANCKRYWI